jgi:hypothetical protein
VNHPKNPDAGNHNGSDGQTAYDPDRDMQVYDRLPRPIRDHMKNCLENWALTRHIGEWVDRDGIGHVLHNFAADNRQEGEKREKQRARATGPWKGNAPLDRSAISPKPRRRSRA